MKGWFITATDTNVGKTFVASALVRLLTEGGVKTGAYKPAASGAISTEGEGLLWEDVEALHGACGGRWTRERICPQRFIKPLAPPFAAEAEGKRLDEQLLLSGAVWWKSEVQHLIVEGAGGWLSPISGRWSNADLAQELNFPVLIVARLGLGTLNHTLLTLEAVERRQLPILGIVMTEAQHLPEDLSVVQNADELRKRTSHPILAVIPHQRAPAAFIPKPLQSSVWLDLALQKRA